MKKIIIINLLVFFAVVSLSAQRERTRVVTATGSYVASMDETPAYGRERALQEAKKQALREADVTESVSTTSIIVMGSAGNEFQEISSELSRIELEGRVRVKSKDEAPPVFTQDNLVKYTTTIRAEVIVEETEEDMNFRFKADGLKSSYLSGELMTFTVTPTMDCYLRVFLLGKHPDSNAQLYPIEGFVRDLKLLSGVPVNFPPQDQQFRFIKDTWVPYVIEMADPSLSVEQDVLLIVALKKSYPFTDKVNYESVIRWLSKIKRSERCVLWQGVNIVKS